MYAAFMCVGVKKRRALFEQNVLPGFGFHPLIQCLVSVRNEYL